MMGFIISKMNMLIMVTAIFAIVAYFTFFFGKSIEQREAQALLDRFSEETIGVLSSNGQCHISVMTIPPYIRSLGTGELNNRLRFLVQIDKIEPPGGGKTQISFSILRKKDERVIASRPFATEATVRLFDWDERSANLTQDSDAQIRLNPVSAIPISGGAGGAPTSAAATDSLLMIKEVYNGETLLYLIPCSSQYGQCSANFAQATCLIKEERNIPECNGQCSSSTSVTEACKQADGFNCTSGV